MNTLDIDEIDKFMRDISKLAGQVYHFYINAYILSIMHIQIAI